MICHNFDKDYTYWDCYVEEIANMVEDTIRLGANVTLEGSPPIGIIDYTQTMLDDILARKLAEGNDTAGSGF